MVSEKFKAILVYVSWAVKAQVHNRVYIHILQCWVIWSVINEYWLQGLDLVAQQNYGLYSSIHQLWKVLIK